jgi:DNA helicase-2/ATP-dependent DNA helicase PcrA
MKGKFPMSNATAPREFNPQQMDIIEMGEGASCVDAGAGSGKTATITERVRRLIEQGVAP